MNRARTSPTAYNVYSAFTVTTSSLVNNVCVASSYSSTLPSAFTQNLAAASGTVYLNAEGEQSFINYIRLTTCSGAGASIVGLQLIHVQNTIAIVTSTFPTVSLMAASRTFPSVSMLVAT